MSLDVLYLVARPVTKQDITKSHYLFNAFKKNLTNYKLISSGELMKHKLLDKGALPQYVQSFIVDNAEVMILGNMLEDRPASATIRGIREKDFIDYGTTKGLFYGLGMLKPDFKYGDWIILTEGPLDRDAFVDIYPNTLALLTASISMMQLDVIETLTNRVILMLDNDEPGILGTKKSRKALQSRGIYVQEIHQPNVKDSGTLAELMAKGKSYEYEMLRDYYCQWVSNITGEDIR